MKQPDGLLSVLLDSSARIDERDDAAMDLSAFDDPRVEQALITAASSDDSDMVITSCCESLAELWCRRGCVPLNHLAALPTEARNETIAIIRATRPDLLAPDATY